MSIPNEKCRYTSKPLDNSAHVWKVQQGGCVWTHCRDIKWGYHTSCIKQPGIGPRETNILAAAQGVKTLYPSYSHPIAMTQRTVWLDVHLPIGGGHDHANPTHTQCPQCSLPNSLGTEPFHTMGNHGKPIQTYKKGLMFGQFMKDIDWRFLIGCPRGIASVYEKYDLDIDSPEATCAQTNLKSLTAAWSKWLIWMGGATVDHHCSSWKTNINIVNRDPGPGRFGCQLVVNWWRSKSLRVQGNSGSVLHIKGVSLWWEKVLLLAVRWIRIIRLHSEALEQRTVKRSANQLMLWAMKTPSTWHQFSLIAGPFGRLARKMCKSVPRLVGHLKKNQLKTECKNPNHR